MWIHDNLPVLPGTILAVLLSLANHGWTQEAATSDQPSSADQPLKTDPARDLFQLALHSYRDAGEAKGQERRRASYLAAARQFDRFHTRFPSHSNAIKACYYKAICYQKTGNTKAYRNSLSEVITIHGKGALVGAAAYQLAIEYYQAEDHAEAARLFKIAATQTDNADYRHRSLYNRALCLEKLGKRNETITALKAILTDAGSPFQSQAERVLAHYYVQSGMEEEALAHFINLSNSKDKKTRADAILQCAQIARSLDKKDFARKYLEKILVTPQLEQWHGESQLALMSEASLAGQHQEVIGYYEQGSYPLEKESLSRRLQIAARAYEALGRDKKATTLFRKLATIAPDNTTALEAGYLVLSRDYKTGNRNLIKQIGTFLERFEKENPDNPHIHNARLMLAEIHNQAGRHGLAIEAYDAIDLAHIASGNQAGLRYRVANVRLKSGDRQGALAAFEGFIEKHPDHPQVSDAIATRAEIFLQLRDSPRAHLEFDRLLREATKASLREYAWAQKAVLYKETIDTTGEESLRNESLRKFADCHTRLLADFPSRNAARKAASEFWCGWSLYRQNKFAECIDHFQRARVADAGSLDRSSTLHLALAHYHLQQQEALRKELDILLKKYRDEKVPRPVFAWLGNALYKDEDYSSAWLYLAHAITPEKPAETKAVTWRAAGHSALEAGAYEEALRPLEIVLQIEDNKYLKAETYFLRGSAHLFLNDPERARKDTEDCLSLKPQGELNARARLQLGDIAMAQDDPDTAAQYYVPVVELYSKDPSMAKKALRRAISALDLKNTEESTRSSQRYRKRLQQLQESAGSASRD